MRECSNREFENECGPVFDPHINPRITIGGAHDIYGDTVLSPKNALFGPKWDSLGQMAPVAHPIQARSK